ncbi:histone deacetylase complex subunit SAP18-like [Tubulanus polymorphus]|uniref:histone deacetylase complex subunit SAP18-like n=1 Tax=Tubulanus polymorphus TaxID=672921 RepID=UPI003DA1CB61
MAAHIDNNIGGDRDPEKTVDREKTCPLLLRVFCNTGHHNDLREYRKGNTPKNELQIYTWKDATLKELASLVKEVNPDARKKGTCFDFGIVFADSRQPLFRLRDIGRVFSGRRTADDNASLASRRFLIGDYIDIAITPPNRNPPPKPRMRPY